MRHWVDAVVDEWGYGPSLSGAYVHLSPPPPRSRCWAGLSDAFWVSAAVVIVTKSVVTVGSGVTSVWHVVLRITQFDQIIAWQDFPGFHLEQ